MKVKKEHLVKINEITKNIDFGITSMRIFFPVDFNIVETNEYGITKIQYKNDSHYGSTLITGLTIDDGKLELAYCSSVDLFSFNLAEYLNITTQTKMSKEDINYISQFEVAICKTGSIYTSEIDLNI